MKVERILIGAIIILLVISIIVPVIILLSVEDKSLAAQIGDTLGGTTAPFVNISAILAVIATYTYQRRNDKRSSEKELLFSIFQNLKDELGKLNHTVTVTSKEKKEVKHYSGGNAIHEIIRGLNDDMYSIETARQLIPYTAIINIYQYLNSLMESVRKNSILTSSEKRMFMAQFSLFYRNNLFIDKDQRGDDICKHHNKIHKIPVELYNEIVNIEAKVI